MNVVKIVFIACLYVVTSSNADDCSEPGTSTNATSSEPVPPAPRETVCNNSCEVVQSYIVTQLIYLNLERSLAERASISLLATVTAISGKLLDLRNFFSNQLSDDEVREHMPDFVNFLRHSFGDEVKVTDELFQLLNVDVNSEERVRMLIDGVYSWNRENTITIEDLAVFFLKIGPCREKIAGYTEALFENTYLEKFPAAGGTSRHGGQRELKRAHRRTSSAKARHHRGLQDSRHFHHTKTRHHVGGSHHHE